MVRVMMVVLPWLDLVRPTGAVNRLEKLLHHLSPPWWEPADALLVEELMMIRVGTQQFPLISNYVFFSFSSDSFFTKRLPLQQRHYVPDNNLLLFVITEKRIKESERANYTLNYQIRSSAPEVSTEICTYPVVGSVCVPQRLAAT